MVSNELCSTNDPWWIAADPCPGLVRAGRGSQLLAQFRVCFVRAALKLMVFVCLVGVAGPSRETPAVA